MTKKRKSIWKKLKLKYKTTKETILCTILDSLKAKLKIWSERKRKWVKRNKFLNQNKTFKTSEKLFYRQLNPLNVDDARPPMDSSERFWKQLWSIPRDCNLEEPWVEDYSKTIKEKMNSPMLSYITSDCLKKTINKSKSTTAPGPDQIQNRYLKMFPCVHPHLLNCFNSLLDTGNVPPWFCKGRTILLPKKGDLTDPKNYRPITCLNTMYKLFTGCLTNLVSTYCSANDIIYGEQKGARKGCWGCKDQLLVQK